VDTGKCPFCERAWEEIIGKQQGQIKPGYEAEEKRAGYRDVLKRENDQEDAKQGQQALAKTAAIRQNPIMAMAVVLPASAGSEQYSDQQKLVIEQVPLEEQRLREQLVLPDE
jgi:hypothetical protein